MSGSGVPLRELALVILVAAAFTYLTTGVVRSFLVRTGRVAEIRLRDAHTQPTPRMGGVAMFTGFAAAIFLAAQLPALTRGFMPVTPEMNAVLWAALALVLVGVVDDLVELSAIVKLFGQLFAATLMSGHWHDCGRSNSGLFLDRSPRPRRCSLGLPTGHHQRCLGGNVRWILAA